MELIESQVSGEHLIEQGHTNDGISVVTQISATLVIRDHQDKTPTLQRSLLRGHMHPRQNKNAPNCGGVSTGNH